MSKICVELVKSTSGASPAQRACLKSLGLWRISQKKVFQSHSTILGNVQKVRHLLKVSNVEGDS